MSSHDYCNSLLSGVVETDLTKLQRISNCLTHVVTKSPPFTRSVPLLVDCGACGGKKSVEDLNLPVVKGLVGDKTVNVLRDTGCEGVCGEP